MRLVACLSILSACILTSYCPAATYIVRPNGSGDYPTIQAAIDAAVTGDVIQLADGTFTGSGNRDVTFRGKAITVRSQSGSADACLIDCQGSTGNEHRAFRFASGDGPSAAIEHITIRNGYIRGGDAAGGAIYCDGASVSPTIHGCVFQNCSSYYGGAICCVNGASSLIEDCSFLGNHAEYRAGGAMAQNSSSPHFLRCLFSGNSSGLPNLTDGGGAFWCGDASYPLFEQCTIVGNSSGSAGGLVIGMNSSVTVNNTIIAFSPQGKAIKLNYSASSHATLSCSDLYGNIGGDWVGNIAGQYGTNGNISADPLFCDATNGNYFLDSSSPCAPAQNPTCGLIGARSVWCGELPHAVRHVDPDGTGEYPTIQAALTACADGDTVLLAAGTYTGDGNRDLDYGGRHVVVLGAGPLGNCTIDCQSTSSEYHRGFVFQSGEDASAVLDGVRIINGRGYPGGGAVYCTGASPTIRRCIAEQCTGVDAGGAVYAVTGSPLIQSCLFIRCAAMNGGGMAFKAGAPIVENCTISENSSGNGHIIFADTGANVSLEKTILVDDEQWIVLCAPGATVSVSCSDIWVTRGFPWPDCIAGQAGMDGNISANPRFCSSEGLGYFLRANSPCAPDENPSCGLIGALPVACVAVNFLVRPDGTGDFPTISAAVGAVAEGDTIELADGIFRGQGNRDVNIGSKGLTIRSVSGDPTLSVIDCEASPLSKHRAFLFSGNGTTETIVQGIGIRNGCKEWGAGIGLYGGAHPLIKNCRVSACTATYNGGGGLYCFDNATPLVQGCVFEGNVAMNGACGGGAFAYACSPTFEACSFENNTVAEDWWGGGVGCYAPASDKAAIVPIRGLADTERPHRGHSRFPDRGMTPADCPSSALPGDGRSVYTPTFMSCSFVGNQARSGGGMLADNVSPIITGCTFRANHNPAGEYSNGGAILFQGNASPVVEDCTFVENSAQYWGGGLEFWECPVPATIKRCVFERNSAAYGGGLSYEYSNTDAVIDSCTFIDNEADAEGGGLLLEASGSGSMSLVVRNSTFFGNSAGQNGGALYSFITGVESCSFAGNSAPTGSATYFSVMGTNTAFTNNILAFNHGGVALIKASGSYPTISCTDIFGNDAGDWVGDLQGFLQYVPYHNRCDDPLFCNLEAGVLSLCSESRCRVEDNPPCGLIGSLQPRCPSPNSCLDLAFSDNFDDCLLDGWSDHTICSSTGSHSFNVLDSPADGSCVLRHVGGSSGGGGNGIAFVPGLRMLDVVVLGDVRNVAAYHPTAKAQGLAARINESTGAQYVFWHQVDGTMLLMRASGWTSCQTLAAGSGTAWPVGERRALELSVIGSTVSAFVNGSLVLSCVDPNPLGYGTVGVIASAGETYFDNIVVGGGQVGACCDPLRGTCSLTLEAGCTGQDVWHPEDATCTPNPCPAPPMGACCNPGGGCTQTTQLDCDSPNSWEGPGSECLPNPCQGGFADDFDDCVLQGWADQKLCSGSGSHTFTVVNSVADSSCVLRYAGGASYGGGNGVAYMPGISMADVEIHVDVRNVAAYHPTAKVQGVTARVDEVTGAQYAFWYAVNGSMTLMKTAHWINSPPYCQTLITAMGSPWPVNERRRLTLSISGNTLAVYVDGSLALSYVDPTPLGPGTIGLTSAAGETYFDNVVATVPYVGACCDLTTGGCTLTAEINCVTPKVWHPDIQTCSPNPCEQVLGVCCYPSENCAITTEIACVAPNVWHPEWSTCEPNPCPVSGTPTFAKEAGEGILGVVPNPSAGATVIWYRLLTEGATRFEVFDASGRAIYGLDLGTQAPGIHSYDWNGRVAGVGQVHPGVYFVRILVGEDSWTRGIVRSR